MEKGIQCGVFRTDRDSTSVGEGDTLVPGFADRVVDETLEGGELFQEAGLELSARSAAATHDLTDLTVARSVEEGVDKGLRVVTGGQSRSFLFAVWMSPERSLA